MHQMAAIWYQQVVSFSMKKISTAQSSLILSLLQSGLSVSKIHKKTGHSVSTISRVRAKSCPDLPRQNGGYPSKLTPANIAYATRLFCMGKAENAVQATKLLMSSSSKPFTPQTLWQGLKKIGWKAVVKRKRPLLKSHHKQAHLAFTEKYKNWTIED